MGYACPVCETPHPDAGHLANHLAFTAMLGDDDHEAWLDDRVPDWAENGEAELAARVEEYAKEAGFPRDVDDATPAHDHGDGSPGGDRFEGGRERTAGRGSGAGGTAREGYAEASTLDDVAGEALRRAREMTRQARDDESGDDEETAGDEKV